MSQASEERAVRWGEILNREYGLALALVSLGIWLHAADSLLVATMVPAIVADIGGEELISWTVALYGIGSIVAGAASGLLALQFGLRLPMTLASFLFMLGCIVSAFAPEMWVMLIGRLLQGIGGGGLMALAFVAVSSLFPRRLIARAMGVISTLWGVSAFIGPLVGGLFVEYGTWQGGFWFFAVQALLLTIWVWVALRRHGLPEERLHLRFPVWRLFWLSIGVLFIAFAGIEISLLKTTLLVVFGILALIAFFYFDGRESDSRMLPARPLSLKNPIGGAMILVLAFSATLNALSVYGPYVITILHGYPPLVGGLIMACMSIGWSVVSFMLSGSPETRDNAMIVLGMLLITLSLPGYAYSLPFGPLWLIALFAVMQGAGFGAAWTFILRRAIRLAPEADHERVSGAIPTLQRLGMAIGAAYAGILANAAGLDGDANLSVIFTVAWLVPAALLPATLVGLVGTYAFVRARNHG